MYRSPNKVKVIKSRRLRWAGHVARRNKRRSAFRVLTGKPRGKRPLGRLRRRWENNIRMDPEEIGINGLHSAPDFTNTIITDEESWVYGYDPETK